MFYFIKQPTYKYC